MKTSTGFMDAIVPMVDTNMTKVTVRKILQDISNFIDRNDGILSDNGLYKQLLINETEQSKLFINMKITPKMVLTALKDSKYIDKTWKTVGNPFNLLIGVMVQRSISDGNIDQANALSLYMAFRLYASKFSRQFKYGVIPNIMAYTVNNLSYKYLLKSKGTLLASLRATILTCIENYKDRMLKGTDKDISDYISGLDDRISDFVINIATEYYKAHKSGSYLNYEEDKVSDDDYQVADNMQFMITRVTNKVTQKLTMYGMDMDIAKSSADICDISTVAIINAINKIYENKLSDLNTLIELLVSIYIVNNPGCKESDVSTKNFFISTYGIYKKNNTHDKNINTVKEIIHAWLQECSEQYKKTNREATLNNFKRSIYIYFILCIQKYSS